ncbi:MAG: 16S rRNA (cytosine(1402)-N(4))-methyltransferase RsmH [Lachnospiraceae bacterium]|nr:16S rRNA (cytosine(1402)-N(4))-methyltransferase RsmH [Lachnospiraceae bacterium]
MEFSHTPIMLDECIKGLNIRKDGIYVDGTMGGAGHSEQIAKNLGPKGKLICIDRDEDAIEAGSLRLKPYGEMVTIVRDNYLNTVSILKNLEIEKIDGILLDLGVSSHQLDDAERGFSYRYDTALDMRMDKRQTLTAKDIVNNYSESELFRVIRDYGEDRFAKNIAKHICQRRKEKPIETTFELNEIIKAAIPQKMRIEGGHPSKRTFQAIRIECNNELEILKDSINGLIESLNPGGRLCIITFHSLEDRIVKTAFKTAENPCTCPPQFPVCVCGKKSLGKTVNRKPIVPDEKETEDNPRSKSAKLRIFEKNTDIR